MTTKKFILTKISNLVENASRSGALKTIETTKLALDENTFLIQAQKSSNIKPTILDTKIQQQELELEHKQQKPKREIKIDPFALPPSDLLLCESNDYFILHNKFNVYTNHLLIVTKVFQSQMEHLHRADFEEIGRVLVDDEWERADEYNNCNLDTSNLQYFTSISKDNENTQSVDSTNLIVHSKLQSNSQSEFKNGLHSDMNSNGLSKLHSDLYSDDNCWYSGEWLIFYNRGVFSGASQPHKHIQLLHIFNEDGTPRFPIISSFNNGNNSSLNYRHGFTKLRGDESMEELYKIYQQMLSDLNLDAEKMFADLILQEKYVDDTMKLENELQVDDLEKDVNHLQLLVGDKLLTIDTSAERIRSYNLLFTSKWMLIVPRRFENCQGISGNSLVFLRSFFVSSEETKAKLLEIGTENLLSHITFEKDHELKEL